MISNFASDFLCYNAIISELLIKLLQSTLFSFDQSFFVTECSHLTLNHSLVIKET